MDAEGEAPEGRGSRRGLLGCAVVLAIFLAGAGYVYFVSWPAFKKARFKYMACFANQRTLNGAVEMLFLDHGERIRTLSEEAGRRLVKRGYLRALPDDPGQGSGSFRNYVLIQTPKKRRLTFCTVHGFISPVGGADHRTSPREQAKAAGVTDQKLLARCSTISPHDGGFRAFLDF
jgi:hypothetical protein